MKNSLDPAELKTAIDKVHRAGMPGVFAEVRDGDQVWRGAAGVADVSTGRPVTPDMRHRVGSITKTFTAAAVLQQVESGQIGLDTPIGHYLPRLVPGERGRRDHCPNADQPHQRSGGLPPVCVPVSQGIPFAGGHHAPEPGRQPVHAVSLDRADRDGSHGACRRYAGWHSRSIFQHQLPTPLPTSGARDRHHRGELHHPKRH